MEAPFTPNKSKNTKCLKVAEKKIIEAITALQAAKASAGNWCEFGTITSFQTQLEELLSCDSGEAGLTPYLSKI